MWAARALDKAGAERTQVGIRFCQIGSDDGVHAFFKHFDDQLKGKYELDCYVGLFDFFRLSTASL